MNSRAKALRYVVFNNNIPLSTCLLVTNEIVNTLYEEAGETPEIPETNQILPHILPFLKPGKKYPLNRREEIKMEKFGKSFIYRILLFIVCIIFVNILIFNSFHFFENNWSLKSLAEEFKTSLHPPIVFSIFYFRLMGYDYLTGIMLVFVVPVLIGFFSSYRNENLEAGIIFCTSISIYILFYEYLKWYLYVIPMFETETKVNSSNFNLMIICEFILPLSIGIVMGLIYKKLMKS